MRNIELLAPAKDYECAIDAILCGADAIYIGVNKFGARKNASNDINDIYRLTDFAHFYNVKIYITLNTVIYDEELKEVEKIIHDLYNHNIDGIIIQDFGILKLNIPPIPLIASTQMNNDSLEKIKFLEEIGFKRVILPRELSLKEIEEISKKVNIELECFIHGALCVSYSGNCYMSYFLGGRSANRGECAQPCRKKYIFYNENKERVLEGYLLSLKDLNLSNYLEKLIDIGITSFKIEGRLKDRNYVKNIVSYYNDLLNTILKNKNNIIRSSNGITYKDFTPDPCKSFNRGFTTFFIEGRKENPANFITQKSTGEYIGKIKKVSKDYIEIDSNKTLSNGDGLIILGKNNYYGTRINFIKDNKIYLQKLEGINNEDEVFRNFDALFEKKLNNSKIHRKLPIDIYVNEIENRRLEFIFKFNNIEVKTIIDNFILANNISLDKSIENLKNSLTRTKERFEPKNLIINLKNPVIFKLSILNKIRNDLLNELEKNIIENYKREEKKLKNANIDYPVKEIDYSFNVCNKLSKRFYLEYGVDIIEDGVEVSKKFKNINLMKSKHCIFYALNLCDKKDKKGYLRSEDNKTFVIMSDCKKCINYIKIYSKEEK